MLFKNTNKTFGAPGPWEAESKEALADEMMATFQQWAHEKWIHAEGLHETRACYVNYIIAEMRTEFLAGLEEVASEGCQGMPINQGRTIIDAFDFELREDFRIKRGVDYAYTIPSCNEPHRIHLLACKVFLATLSEVAKAKGVEFLSVNTYVNR